MKKIISLALITMMSSTILAGAYDINNVPDGLVISPNPTSGNEESYDMTIEDECLLDQYKLEWKKAFEAKDENAMELAHKQAENIRM